MARELCNLNPQRLLSMRFVPYWNGLQLHVISSNSRRRKVIRASTSHQTGQSGASGMQDKYGDFIYRFAYTWHQAQSNHQLESKLRMKTYNRNSVPEHIRTGNSLKTQFFYDIIVCKGWACQSRSALKYEACLRIMMNSLLPSASYLQGPGFVFRISFLKQVA